MEMLDRAEQEGQRKRVGDGNERAERPHIGAVDVDRAGARLLDGLLLLAELARMEDPDPVAPVGALLDQAAHVFERPHGRVVGRLGVGGAKLARHGVAHDDGRQPAAREDADGEDESRRDHGQGGKRGGDGRGSRTFHRRIISAGGGVPCLLMLPVGTGVDHGLSDRGCDRPQAPRRRLPRGDEGAARARSRRLLVLAAPAPAATIELWHAMSGELGRQLAQLAAGFNASQSEHRVVPEYKGNYTETVTAAIFAVRTKKQPAIVQVNEIATATMMAAKGAIYPAFELMRAQGVAFDQAAYLPAVSGYYSDLAGNLLSFPFNASTPILYYNKDLFRAAGLDENSPPRTWPEVEAAARKLRQAERPLRLHHPLAVLGERREFLRLAQRADRDPRQRPRRLRRRAHDRQSR